MTPGSEWRRPIAGATVGLLYGSSLAFLALGAAGAGHGTLVPLLLSSAPLGVFWVVADTDAGRNPTFLAMLYGAPPLWAALCAMVAPGARGKGLGLARFLVLLHYASGLALVASTVGGLPDVLADLKRTPQLVVMWATVYLVGQAALWWQLGKRNHVRPAA
jgi:hypothetical protein